MAEALSLKKMSTASPRSLSEKQLLLGVTAQENFSIFLEGAQAKKSDRAFFCYKYYPFGLQTANSWTRENAAGNDFLYNEGSELNKTTGFYDLPFRNYDASLGRFFQVDPLAHSDHTVSPFAYAGNNPVMFSDPSGLVKDYATSWQNPDYVNKQMENAFLAGLGAANAGWFSSPGWVTDSFDNWAATYGLGGSGGYYGGPGWITVGNLSVNFRLIPKGTYIAFDFKDGMVVNYNMWSDADIAEMGLQTFAGALGLTPSTSSYTGDPRLWQASNGDYVQSNGSGGWRVAYTDVDYGAYLASQITKGGNDNFYGSQELNSGSGGLHWDRVLAAEVYIWGAAATIAEHNSKPLYQGAKSWAAEAKLAGKVGRALGTAGLLLTAVDMKINGVNTSNTLDATFGAISFAGPVGAAIGGAYFVGNLITVGITGKTIGEHIDEHFYIMSGGSLAPIILVPKN